MPSGPRATRPSSRMPHWPARLSPARSASWARSSPSADSRSRLGLQRLFGESSARRVHPQDDVEVAETIVHPADIYVRVDLRVIDQLVDTRDHLVRLDEAPKHLPVNLVSPTRQDPQLAADHVVAHGEQIWPLARTQLRCRDPRIGCRRALLRDGLLNRQIQPSIANNVSASTSPRFASIGKCVSRHRQPPGSALSAQSSSVQDRSRADFEGRKFRQPGRAGCHPIRGPADRQQVERNQRHQERPCRPPIHLTPRH